LIKAIFTSSVKKRFPRVLILKKKILRVNLKESIIVISELVNRKEILRGIRNMKNIFKNRDFYNRATSCATLLSFVPSFTTCSILPLYCTLVLNFAIPSIVRPFSTVHDMWAPRKSQLIPCCNQKNEYLHPAPPPPPLHLMPPPPPLHPAPPLSAPSPPAVALGIVLSSCSSAPSPPPPDRYLVCTVGSGPRHRPAGHVPGSTHRVPTGPSVV
jgi:hypothetical protein